MEQAVPKMKYFGTGNKPTGEPFVWCAAMGLTLGLTLIVSLMGLILVKGVAVFWPDRAVVLELKPGSTARLGGSEYLAGVVTKEQKILRRAKDISGGEDAGRERMEWQLFLGNKDIYGISFKYVDYADISRTAYPEDLIRIERMEYGDAFGFPVYLEIAGEDPIEFSSAAFLPRLHALVRDVSHRWDEIRKIERDEIGAINLKIERLRLRKKKLDRDVAQNADALEEAALKLTDLQNRYNVLAAEATDLRQQQSRDALVYQLATDQKKRLPVGEVVHFYFPNRLNFIDRVGLFFHRLWVFLSETPREANTEGGAFPAIFGTFVMTVLMSVAVMPFGVLAAIYLREYAKQGILVRSVRIAVNNLAGVPSIVFGVFGLGFFVYFVGGSIDRLFYSDALPTPTFGTGGIFWASLTLALLTVPVVIVATEEALASVPRGVREGSLACGASKWQTILNVVLPASAPGILTGLILAMARGASEVAPLMLVGVVKLAPTLPVDGLFPFFHLERKFMHLGFYIYDLGFQSPDSEAAKPMVFAATLLLIALVVVLNLGAVLVRQRLRKKIMAGAF
ncbi:MAG: phosphate ABC transporter permease PstA [Candidatus Omnitrophota bacterium]|nr:phosphate ABC transporter permease PstA [Candidatus Omnitrophota bacterium]